MHCVSEIFIQQSLCILWFMKAYLQIFEKNILRSPLCTVTQCHGGGGAGQPAGGPGAEGEPRRGGGDGDQQLPGDEELHHLHHHHHHPAAAAAKVTTVTTQTAGVNTTPNTALAPCLAPLFVNQLKLKSKVN